MPGGRTRLTCLAVKTFAVGRLQTWGPSIYVNDAALTDAAHGLVRLWIEMQSGDEITVTAERAIVGEP